ncbi:unnamed protein product [Dovyalis caffra]|uniref:Uncharacterized protein n=1 Tax=Dovyalis caffra TaxID=77055 RepID=A0AAV1RA08_9ROSI|nr:unnamed protein product [Dovyalis caffra]
MAGGATLIPSDDIDVDFSKVAALAQQVEERSSLMGAEHMRLACADLIQACRQMDKRK